MIGIETMNQPRGFLPMELQAADRFSYSLRHAIKQERSASRFDSIELTLRENRKRIQDRLISDERKPINSICLPDMPISINYAAPEMTVVFQSIGNDTRLLSPTYTESIQLIGESFIAKPYTSRQMFFVGTFIYTNGDFSLNSQEFDKFTQMIGIPTCQLKEKLFVLRQISIGQDKPHPVSRLLIKIKDIFTIYDDFPSSAIQRKIGFVQMPIDCFQQHVHLNSDIFCSHFRFIKFNDPCPFLWGKGNTVWSRHN